MTNPPEFQVSSGGATTLPQAVSVARKTPRQLFWDRLAQDKAALAGGVVIVLLILIAIVGGPIARAHHRAPAERHRTRLDGRVRRADRPELALLVRRRRRRAATSSCARCTARAPRCSSASSPPGIAVLIGLVVGLTAGFFGGIVDTAPLARRRRDARAAADPDRDRHRRRVLVDEERLPRRRCSSRGSPS